MAENAHDEMSFNVNPFAIRDYVVTLSSFRRVFATNRWVPVMAAIARLLLAELARNAASTSRPFLRSSTDAATLAHERVA